MAVGVSGRSVFKPALRAVLHANRQLSRYKGADGEGGGNGNASPSGLQLWAELYGQVTKMAGQSDENGTIICTCMCQTSSVFLEHFHTIYSVTAVGQKRREGGI